MSYFLRNHLIDFNDMINKAIDLVENKGIFNNFKYIFVDEYQDISYKNFQFIKTLKHQLVMLIWLLLGMIGNLFMVSEIMILLCLMIFVIISQMQIEFSLKKVIEILRN